MGFDTKMGRRTFLKGTAAASAIAAMAGCKKDDATATAEGGTTTVSYYINNPECIDPFNLQEDQGTKVGAQLFDSLTKYDFENGEIKGAAAESWDVNDDATEFTFHLVEGAKFHNGDAVDAASFQRAWNRIVDPNTNPDSPSVISYHIAMVEGYDELMDGSATEMSGLSCPDENTFVVKLSEPYADFPYVASHPALGPVPQAAVDDFDTFYLAPIGNGPFQMDGKWEDGQYINLVKFDDYYGEPAKVDALYFNIQKDVETAYKEFQAGNLDVAEVPNAQLEEAASTYGTSSDGYTANPGEQMLDGAEPSTYYIVTNVQDPVMQDVNLRKAVSLAINRQAICDTVFLGSREPAGNIIPPGIDGYEENAWADAHYDKDAAVEILDQYYPADANGDRGLNLTLSYNGDGDHKAIMELVSADLEAVGIKTTHDVSEWAALLDRYQAGDYQMGRLGWIADYPIMDNFLYPLFYTGNGDNRSQYSNPDVDAALSAARTTVDDDERRAALQAVNRQIGDDMPVIPVMYYKHTSIASSRLQNFYLDPQKIPSLETTEVVEG
jgi:peptide/nickel transport system substrate-binding protein/oligopeptide transport system substrate-binding protein